MRHKHADLIHAWAEGAEIEWFDGKFWLTTSRPTFSYGEAFRVKPQPKPDVVRYFFLRSSGAADGCGSGNGCAQDNIKAVFDGETHELKSAEVICKP